MRQLNLAILLTLLVPLGCAASAVQGLVEPETSRPRATRAPVTASDYAANVDVLALGYRDGTFEVRSPTPTHVLSHGKHAARVVNVALSKDARKLATVDARGHVAISTLEDGTLELLADLDVSASPLENGAPRVGLEWDGMGDRLALTSGTLVRVVDLKECTTTEARLPEPAYATAFSPGGKQLLAAGTQLYFLGLPTLAIERRLAAPGGAVTEVRYSPDGAAVGVVSTSGVAFLDVAQGRFDFAALPRLKPVGLRFAGDGRVAVFGAGAVYAGAPEPARMDEARQETRGKLTDVEFRRDGSLLILGEGVEEDLATLLEPARLPED